jgi:hypothetical protein
VSFLKGALHEIKLAWTPNPSDLSHSAGSSSPETTARRLANSVIIKTRTAQGLVIIANIELVAINIMYILNKVNVKLKAYEYIPLTFDSLL